jgi:hypothetical protein
VQSNLHYSDVGKGSNENVVYKQSGGYQLIVMGILYSTSVAGTFHLPWVRGCPLLCLIKNVSVYYSTGRWCVGGLKWPFSVLVVIFPQNTLPSSASTDITTLRVLFSALWKIPFATTVKLKDKIQAKRHKIQVIWRWAKGLGLATE